MKPVAEERVIGSDEVGYGSWAGPLYVCAVAVPRSWVPPNGLNDSKLVKPSRRIDLYKALCADAAIDFSISAIDNEAIDVHGVYTSLLMAHTDAVRGMLRKYPGNEVVVDGNLLLPGVQHRTLPKADRIIPAVMAASIIAKVNRDYLMHKMEDLFPGYDFKHNVGYHSKLHVEGLKRLGVCPLHRRSYRPIREYIRGRPIREYIR